MDKKKILLVSRSFYPTNSPRSFRTTELAKRFKKLGHDVTVITVRDELVHSEFEKIHGITIKDMGVPKWKSIKLKGKGIALLSRRILKRLGDWLFLYPQLELMGMVKNTLAKERDYSYDLLISIAVPFTVHFGVAKARKINRPLATTWIADCGDPFMGIENDTFKYPFFYKYVEKWLCRKVDYLTVPTEGAIQAYYKEFHSKIKVIPQGFDFNDYNFERNPTNNSVPTFAYAGGFIQGRRDPREFLEYLNSLNIDFRFHVYTYTDSFLQPYAKNSKGRIIFHPVIPRVELLKKLSLMDFVVNFENIGSKQTPSKLIDYHIIKKPILSIRTNHLDPEVIDQFLKGDFHNQYIIDNPEQYNIENVCDRFLALNSYENVNQ